VIDLYCDGVFVGRYHTEAKAIAVANLLLAVLWRREGAKR